jgi:hypothetical protein
MEEKQIIHQKWQKAITLEKLEDPPEESQEPAE